MNGIEVRIAKDSERARVIAAIVAGFITDSVARWCWSEPNSYLTNAPRFMNAYGGRAFEQGCAWTDTSTLSGALWLPPGTEPDEEELGSVVTSTMDEEKRGYLFAALEELGTYHPSEPHWFLPLIAVDPPWQGRGIGSQLMKHAVARCGRCPDSC